MNKETINALAATLVQIAGSQKDDAQCTALNDLCEFVVANGDGIAPDIAATVQKTIGNGWKNALISEKQAAVLVRSASMGGYTFEGIETPTNALKTPNTASIFNATPLQVEINALVDFLVKNLAAHSTDGTLSEKIKKLRTHLNDVWHSI